MMHRIFDTKGGNKLMSLGKRQKGQLKFIGLQVGFFFLYTLVLLDIQLAINIFKFLIWIGFVIGLWAMVNDSLQEKIIKEAKPTTFIPPTTNRVKVFFVVVQVLCLVSVGWFFTATAWLLFMVTLYCLYKKSTKINGSNNS